MPAERFCAVVDEARRPNAVAQPVLGWLDAPAHADSGDGVSRFSCGARRAEGMLSDRRAAHVVNRVDVPAISPKLDESHIEKRGLYLVSEKTPEPGSAGIRETLPSGYPDRAVWKGVFDCLGQGAHPVDQIALFSIFRVRRRVVELSRSIQSIGCLETVSRLDHTLRADFNVQEYTAHKSLALGREISIITLTSLGIEGITAGYAGLSDRLSSAFILCLTYNIQTCLIGPAVSSLSPARFASISTRRHHKPLAGSASDD